MTKVFSISGKLEQAARWSDQKEDFSGNFVVENIRDDDELGDFFRGTVTSANGKHERFIFGYWTTDDNGNVGISALILSTDSKVSPIAIAGNLTEGTLVWASYSPLYDNFIQEGQAKLDVREYPDGNPNKILADHYELRRNELDVNHRLINRFETGELVINPFEPTFARK